tara:strand:- start:1881 stop:2186 length:306 start_codon:yes stop_codon:yes gene_type:complete
MSKTATVKFVEDEDIYIDCRPVTTYGGEVIVTDKDNNQVTSGVNTEIIDSIALNFSNGNITKNIGFQSVVGVTLLAILYGIGNYVFKELPKNLIDKRLRQQ